MKILGIYLMIITILYILGFIILFCKSKDIDEIKSYIIALIFFYIPNFLFIFNFLINYNKN